MATALAVTIQLGVPVAVLFVIGYLAYLEAGRRDRRTVRQSTGGQGRGPALAKAVADGSRRPCWQMKHCRADQRATCPACRRVDLPCWQARKVVCGRLEADCIDCELFLAPPARV